MALSFQEAAHNRQTAGNKQRDAYIACPGFKIWSEHGSDVLRDQATTADLLLVSADSQEDMAGQG